MRNFPDKARMIGTTMNVNVAVYIHKHLQDYVRSSNTSVSTVVRSQNALASQPEVRSSVQVGRGIINPGNVK